MSLLWVDGFDQYPGAESANISGNLASAGYAETNAATGFTTFDSRSGLGRALFFGINAGLYRAIKPQASVITGFAHKFSAPAFAPVVQFRVNDFLGSEDILMQLFRNANGALTVACYSKVHPNYQEFPNVVAYYHSDENMVFPNVWHSFEVLYTPGTTGSIIVKVDGMAAITATGVLTAFAGLPNVVNVVGFPSAYAGAYSWLDDWYIIGNDSSGLSDFLGDVVVHAVFPNGDAGSNTMTQVGGGIGHFTAVNDPSSPDETSYVTAVAAGNSELYTLAALPTDIIDVLAVQVSVRTRKDGPGSAQFKLMAQNGTYETDSPLLSNAMQYVNKFMILEAAPGGGAWTPTNAQSLKIGFKTV